MLWVRDSDPCIYVTSLLVVFSVNLSIIVNLIALNEAYKQFSSN